MSLPVPRRLARVISLSKGILAIKPRNNMPTLQQQIVEKFLARLAETKDVDAEKIARLRALLADGKKVKAEDFVKVFSLPAGGDLK